MTICKRCGKENQDHFKFCLGCGGELTPASPQPGAAMAKTVVADPSAMPQRKPGASPTPPGGIPSGMGGNQPPAQGAQMGGNPYMQAPTPFTPAPGGSPFGAPPVGNPWGPPPASAAPLPGVPPMNPMNRPNAPAPLNQHGMAPPGMTPPAMAPAPGGYGQPSTNKPKSAAVPTPAQSPMGPPPGAPSPAFGAAPPMTGPATPQPAGGTRPCPNCGFEVPVNFMFCGACGQKLTPVSARPGTANPQAAAINAPATIPETRARGRLTLIRPDGTEGGLLDLEEGENKIGRQSGPLFENDGYLSPVHAELYVRSGGQAVVRDANSLNGVFVKITGEEEVTPGDTFRIGQELIRFETIAAPSPLEDGTEIMGSPNPGYWGRLSIIIGKDIEGSAFPLLGDAVTMGRERGDINFPDDGYVSGLHARLTQRGGKFYLNDLGSSNGTFLKIRSERSLQNGSFILLGQQLFRVNLT